MLLETGRWKIIMIFAFPLSQSQDTNKKPHRQHFSNVSSSIRSVRRPANHASYNHPCSNTQQSIAPCNLLGTTLGSNPLLPLWTCLLVHHGIRGTQISLRILKFLNHAMLALLAFISNQFTVPFLDFLVNQPHFSYQSERLG